MGVRKKKTAKTKRKLGKYKIKTKKDKKPNQNKIKLPSKKAQALWDHERTLIENYKTLGLSYDTNATIKGLQEKIEQEYPEKEWSLSEEVEDDVEGKNELKDLLEVPEPAEPKAPKLGIRERHYYRRLHEKYGDNIDVPLPVLHYSLRFFLAMVKDVKLNYNQYTKKQIKKKLEIYLMSYKSKLDAKLGAESS